MNWFSRLLGGRRTQPSPQVIAVLTDLATWLETPTVGYEKKVAEMLEELSKAWRVPAREESGRGVAQFFENRLLTLQKTTTNMTLEIDRETGWWETPPGYIFSVSVRFDRQVVGDQLISGRMYQVGRIGANKYLIVGK